MKVSVRIHPETLYSRMQNSVQLTLRVENEGEARWVEAELKVPDKISLAPDIHLNEGRMRAGIVGKNEALEKSVKVYASAYTDAQRYECRLVVFSYDKDAVIDQRIEVPFTVNCEEQKPAVL
ncbi:MAG: hypothetical protein PHS02_03070 [Candidatus ainarchaeum sp.]|nr:hypothetical protein [Candidatus ainarchaeum sp.]